MAERVWGCKAKSVKGVDLLCVTSPIPAEWARSYLSGSGNQPLGRWSAACWLPVAKHDLTQDSTNLRDLYTNCFQLFCCSRPRVRRQLSTALAASALRFCAAVAHSSYLAMRA